jgi:hypothetical protein
MKRFGGVALLTLLCVQLLQANPAVEELRPVLKKTLNGIRNEILSKATSDRSSSITAAFLANIVEDAATDRLTKLESFINEYEEKTQEMNAILSKATETLRNPPNEKINYAALVAEDLILLMPKVQELSAQAQQALQNAAGIARSINWAELSSDVTGRVMELNNKGILSWISGIISGGPTYIINNIASFMTGLSPNNAASIAFVQYVAQTIVDTLGTLGSTLTQTAATQLLAFLGPFKETLGNLYTQIEFSLQQTFPSIFAKQF